MVRVREVLVVIHLIVMVHIAMKMLLGIIFLETISIVVVQQVMGSLLIVDTVLIYQHKASINISLALLILITAMVYAFSKARQYIFSGPFNIEISSGK